MTETVSNIGQDLTIKSDNNAVYKSNDDYEYKGSNISSRNASLDLLPKTVRTVTQIGTGTSMGDKEDYDYSASQGGFRKLTDNEKKSIGNPSGLMIDDSAIQGVYQRNIYANPTKRNELLMNNYHEHQNAYQFPKMIKKGSDLLTADYDYRIIPNDPRYAKTQNLEDKLKVMRASLGLQVHGNNEIGREMKYYSYNRFKVPDINLAFNKSTTHVFFTRPDLNILTYAGNGLVGTINEQAKHSTDASILWSMNPSLFKLLTNCERCGDENNFNMLLSQQISSWEIPDDELKVSDVGKSYNNFSISYGETWNGRQGGILNCNFDELADLSVINLMRLWLMYIDKVSRGAWSPSYNLKGYGINTSDHTASHVYMKALDYAASAYVFKCGPDGEDIIYWEKYYGVFPTKSGASGLSWNKSDPIGNKPNITIPIRYCWREPMSIVSLLEFNQAAHISGEKVYSSPSFNPNFNHSSRPYVGCPYIEFDLAENGDALKNNGVNYAYKKSHIRLKFKNDIEGAPSDNTLFKSDLGKSSLNKLKKEYDPIHGGNGISR